MSDTWGKSQHRVVCAAVSSHGGFLSCLFIVGVVCTVVNINESGAIEKSSSKPGQQGRPS